MVAQRVLIANIARHFGGDLIYLFNRLGKEGDAAGLRGEHLQRPVRVAHLGVGHLVAEQQSDGVDDRPGELLNAADGLFQVQGRGVVFAVGNQDQHLLGPLGVGHQLIRGCHHGVVERGAASGLDVTQPVAQLVHVGGKLLVDEGLVGKVHYKGLVLRVRGMDQIQRALVHRRALARHGPGVVHHHRNRNRKIGVLETDEGLLDAVL